MEFVVLPLIFSLLFFLPFFLFHSLYNSVWFFPPFLSSLPSLLFFISSFFFPILSFISFLFFYAPHFSPLSFLPSFLLLLLLLLLHHLTPLTHHHHHSLTHSLTLTHSLHLHCTPITTAATRHAERTNRKKTRTHTSTLKHKRCKTHQQSFGRTLS